MSQPNFRSLALYPSIQKALSDLEFEQPTPIQRDSIPPALAGHDVLACAATGSGKTAAFLLPILQRLARKPRGTTRALILTPTRELAAQIVEHFEALAKYTKVRAAAIYGGVGMTPQEAAFRKGIDVMVACPGRLLDHFSRPYGRLDGLEVLVLDEVDRMLDMGFLPDVRRVLRHLPKADQALFFSATLAPPIARLARELLDDPVTLHVERQSKPADGIEQSLWPVPEHLKRPLLLNLIERGEIFDALVFTRTKHRANRLADFLSRRGVACDRIHGNRSQAQRTRALANFKNGKIQILVATDIAARGIDVTELSHVVNFDPPHLPEDYIHRIGRTARAGATGDAFTFITPQESSHAREIERAVGRRLPRRELEGFDYGVEAPPRQQQPARPSRKPSSRKSAERREDTRPGQRGSGKTRAGKPGNRRTAESRDAGHQPAGRPKRRSGGRGAGDGATSQRSDQRGHGENRGTRSRPQTAEGRGAGRGSAQGEGRGEGRQQTRPSKPRPSSKQGPSKPRRRSQAPQGQGSSGEGQKRSGSRSRRRRAS